MNTPVTTINPERFDKADLATTVQVLKSSGVIAYPTETVYGLGCDVFCEDAFDKIYRLKGRESSRPISMMIATQSDVERFCTDVSPAAIKLMASFWPGPLTIVLKASDNLPGYLVSGNGTVGIRFPGHAVSRVLVELLGSPITSTSANRSGEPSAIHVNGLSADLLQSLDLVLDGGRTSVGVASTVIDMTAASPKILRAGAIPADSIRKLIG